MKKLGFVLLLCFSGVVFSQSSNAADAPCLKWKKVCHQKEACVYKDGKRSTCFRCIKPNHYGFHLYPHQIDRNTCNLKTVHYLQTMGYRCFQPMGSQNCAVKKVTQQCDRQCVKYEKGSVR